MIKHLSKSRRKTVGFFIDRIEGDFNNLLCQSIIDAAEDYDVNLLLFPGKQLNPSISEEDYQFNVVYDYLNENSLDALIVCSGSIINTASAQELAGFLSKYKDFPIVTISLQIEDIPCILIDNRFGLKQAFEHLIKHHGKQKIAFIRGPSNNTEAEERYSVYLEALKENKLDFDEDLVFQGDFFPESGTKAIENLIDIKKMHFDALVAANDDMALAALLALQERNIKVPEDVSIIGFDNIIGAKVSIPSLSTVGQPVYELSRKALEMVLMLLNGRKLENIILNTNFIIRESCGCLPEEFRVFNTEVINCNRNNFSSGDYDYFIDLILKENINDLNTATINIESMRKYIYSCFKEILSESFNYQSVENLLKTFKTTVYSKNMTEDNIITIQKIITKLKAYIFALIDDQSSSYLIEDFFQMLRVFSVDLVLKEKEEQWNFHHCNIKYLRSILELMISNINEKEYQLLTITSELSNLGIRSFLVFLFGKEIIHRKSEIWTPTETLILELAFLDGKVLTLDKEHSQIDWREVLNNPYLPRERRYTLAVSPLFFMDEQLGLVLCEFNHRDAYMFESLLLEMGCSLKFSYLLGSSHQIEYKLRNALEELEDYNENLSRISQTDELTGLYNRRGFINLSKQTLKLSRNINKEGIIFFFDIDGLKIINDMYGHDEGDYAIKTVSEFLKKTFRKGDIIARIGGDEFLVFTIGLSNEFLHIVLERLNKLIGDYNKSSGKPYSLLVSNGKVNFSVNGNYTIEDLINEADKLMYMQKEEKRKKTT